MLALERNLHKTLPLGPEENQAAYRSIQQRNGLKVFGVAGIALQALWLSDVAERAKQNGISVWDQILVDAYENAGYQIIYPNDQCN